MLHKSTLVSTLLAAIIFNVLGYAFYDFIAGDYFESHTVASITPIMDPLYISIGSLLMAFAMANLYRKQTVNFGFTSGFTFGAWIGFLIGFGMGTIMYGTSGIMDLQSQIVDSVWCLFYYGIAGGTIGWTNKKLTLSP
jgi:hypothetical protein